jgi:putative NADH-flavin reductase
MLRRGKSTAFTSADLEGEAGLAARVTFCFGAERSPSLNYTAMPKPTGPSLEASADYYDWPIKPNFVNHFEGRLAAGARPTTPGARPEMLVWLRHRDRNIGSGIVGLLALADALPPASTILFREPAPISTMTWSIEMLDAAPASADGWWLVQCVAETARQGYSAQSTSIWNPNGQPILVARQTIAIFGQGCPTSPQLNSEGIPVMHVVLFAATGRAGRTILNELINRGHQVTAVARNLDKLPETLPQSVKRIRDDLSNVDRIAEIMSGADAVVSAYGPPSSDPRYMSDISYTDQLVTVTDRLIAAARKSQAPRLIVVGGAGSLEFSPGVTVLNSGYWPQHYVQIATSHTKAFAALKASNINWTYFSPPMLIQPGERTGKFRLGGDNLIKDAEGKSLVSFEDYAVALVDELEKPAHERSRFTIGY